MYHFRKTGLAESLRLQKWHDDTAVRRWVAIDNWNAYTKVVSKLENYYLYSVYDQEELIAHISAEIKGKTASICLVVNPLHHGKGIGYCVLNEMIQNTQRLFGDVSEYIAGIYPENISSVKCFIKAGFLKSGNGADGEDIYILHVKEN